MNRILSCQVAKRERWKYIGGCTCPGPYIWYMIHIISWPEPRGHMDWACRPGQGPAERVYGAEGKVWVVSGRSRPPGSWKRWLRGFGLVSHYITSATGFWLRSGMQVGEGGPGRHLIQTWVRTHVSRPTGGASGWGRFDQKVGRSYGLDQGPKFRSRILFTRINLLAWKDLGHAWLCWVC